ncbi:MAG: hypothetical protein U0172_03455 [Nitrospiraceae bacterium]
MTHLARLLLVIALLCIPALSAHAQSWPNEPSGSTLLSDHNYSSLAGDGWSIQGSGVSVVQDGSAPFSPSSVMQHRFGPGLPGGTSVGVSYFPLSPTRRELYMGFYWKASSNWEGGSLGGGQKISFIQGAGAWNMVMLLNPNGKISVYFPNTEQVQNCQLQGSWGDCPGTVQVYPNVSNPTIGFGGWHLIEYYVKMSSSSSSNDGIIRWWVDGQLNGNFTNANFPQYQIIQAEFDPTWGNVGDTKTTETFFWYDHVRVSTGGTSSGGSGGGGVTPPSPPPPPPPPPSPPSPPNAPTLLRRLQ